MLPRSLSHRGYPDTVTADLSSGAFFDVSGCASRCEGRVSVDLVCEGALRSHVLEPCLSNEDTAVSAKQGTQNSRSIFTRAAFHRDKNELEKKKKG
ncbi:hypothetical protein RRG08_000175 [Elysia crispata]|uniref:Uncharacterized protein n=1 Tax=Elysia crispata TaxID=231223 RepID=A0AAE1D528_9GAST|nr:hypothetical protein RRG08_000175 [Elysia crispata]